MQRRGRGIVVGEITGDGQPDRHNRHVLTAWVRAAKMAARAEAATAEAAAVVMAERVAAVAWTAGPENRRRVGRRGWR